MIAERYILKCDHCYETFVHRYNETFAGATWEQEQTFFHDAQTAIKTAESHGWITTKANNTYCPACAKHLGISKSK